MTEFQTLALSSRGAVATIYLNRPERNNSLTLRSLFEMRDLIRQLMIRPEIHIVVLTGRGGPGTGFCPGADLLAIPEGNAGSALDPGDLTPYQVPALLHEMPQVTIAAINGGVGGAGLGWACACDFRVAAESARFSTAFLNLGLAGDMALPWTLPKLVGSAKARELCFLSEKLTAEDAARMGLVTEVYPDDLFLDSLNGFVERLAGVAPEALRAMKANFLAAERLPLPDFSDYETMRHLALAKSPEVRQRMAEFGANRRV